VIRSPEFGEDEDEDEGEGWEPEFGAAMLNEVTIAFLFRS
jgi:hypothetical protein